MPRADATFDKRTLRERCTAHIRDRIIAGGLVPGEHLVETRLADELGVSRGTLRESLRPLELEGLLVGDGRGHMSVRKLSMQEVLDLFQVRSALERLAVSLLAQREDRDEITARLTAALEPLRDDDLPFAQKIEVDLGFHALLCELTGNPTLVTSWRQLIGQIEMMIIAAGPGRASDRMRFAEHIVIAEAIGSGDEERAAQVLSAHMDDFTARFSGDFAD